MSFFFRLHKYLNKQDSRPLLPREYRRAGETTAALSTDERFLVTMRYARTADAARDLLKTYGCLGSVIANVPQPKRKAPPRLRRLWRVIRRMFP